MNPPARQGHVLYDDSCDFCRRWIPFWRHVLSRRGFAIAPLQAEWVRQRLQLPEEELIEDLRLLLVSGEVIRGANVYRYVLRRIWWAYPLYELSIVPVASAIFDGCYRTFARNRFFISSTCGLSAKRAMTQQEIRLH